MHTEHVIRKIPWESNNVCPASETSMAYSEGLALLSVQPLDQNKRS